MLMTVRAVIYDAYQSVPTIADVADPTCPPDGVVLSVAATGVCRSDWHAWMGHDPAPLPMVPGHEYAGVIAEVGADVTGWKAGDRVAVPFALGCGACEVCAAGNTQVCLAQQQPGFTMWGSFAEFVAVPFADANLVALPDLIDFIAAASLGCRFATAYRAVIARGRASAGEWVVIHGAGGVGLSAIQIAVAQGSRVVAVDVSPAALEAASRFGAEVCILGPDDVVPSVIEATDGGAHLSIDALGSIPTMRASVECLRVLGRHVQVGLMLEDAADTAVPMGRVIARELELLGSHGMPATDYPAMLELVASGRVDPAALVSRVISLDEGGAAIAAMSQPATQAGMTVIDLSLR
jgi:alcohol dehydrogenase